jgi:hypothetical protein
MAARPVRLGVRSRTWSRQFKDEAGLIASAAGGHLSMGGHDLDRLWIAFEIWQDLHMFTAIELALSISVIVQGIGRRRGAAKPLRHSRRSTALTRASTSQTGCC